MTTSSGNPLSLQDRRLRIRRIYRLSLRSRSIAKHAPSPYPGTPDADLWKVYALALAIALVMFLLSCYLSARNRHHRAAHKEALSYIRRIEDTPRRELSFPVPAALDLYVSEQAKRESDNL